MKREFRITKNEEFSKIVSKKKSFANDFFVLYTNDRRENHCRVGISVSKKLGDAVVRNKIKRQIRMMIINIIDFENYPLDLIVIARPKYLENSFEDNQKQLEKLSKKAII